jgi:DNA-binding CsgD family transcriptional regulator
MDEKKASINEVSPLSGASMNLRLLYSLATVGFGFLCGWELILMFSPLLPLLGFVQIQGGIILYIVALVACALTALLVRRHSFQVLEHRKLCFSVGSSVAFIAIVVSAFCHIFGMLPLVVVGIAWLFLGIGQTMLIIAWGTFLSVIPSKHTVTIAALGSIMGTLLFIMVASIEVIGMNLLGTGFLFLVALVVVLFLFSNLQQGVLPSDEYKPTPALFRPSVLGAVLHNGAYGFTLVMLFSFGFIPALIGASAGAVGAFTALIWSWIKPRWNLETTAIQYVTMPIVVCGLLLMPLFGVSGKIVCCCLINIAHAFHRTASIGVLATANSEYRFHPVRQFAIGRVPTLVGLLAGTSLGFAVLFVFHSTEYVFDWTVTSIVIIIVCAIATYGFINTERGSRIRAYMIVDEVDGEKPSVSTGISETALSTVIALYGLSPRESEVFALLARGRNTEYIQNRLFLASGTVKTHIYHIYQKIGINTQQQLIDIAEKAEEGL